MLNRIREVARISPPGFIYVRIYPILDIEANGGVPDDAPVLFSKVDQRTLLKKFEADGLILMLTFDEDHNGAVMVLDRLDKDSDENPYEKSKELLKSYKKELTTDLERGILAIGGKSVSISTRAGKANYPLQLLRTLMKEPEADLQKGEILSDWAGEVFLSENDLKNIPRNRVYAAARVLNSKILEQAGVKDFIIYDTFKFRINPDYLNKI